MFQHNRHGLVVEWIGLSAATLCAEACGKRAASALVGAIENRFIVLCLARLLDVIHNPHHFIVGNKRAMHSYRQARTGRQEQHIALAQQGLGSHLIKHRTGIDLAGDLK